MNTMKYLFILLSMLSAQFLLAQSNTTYKAHAEGWLVSFDEAKQLSDKTGKPIMANFTGSDWCGWCKKLKREVFDKEEFKKWASENVILLELDFPRRHKIPREFAQQNASLQRAFKVRGYPSIWLFDLADNSSDGDIRINAYGKTGYVRGGPSEFISTANKIIANGK